MVPRVRAFRQGSASPATLRLREARLAIARGWVLTRLAGKRPINLAWTSEAPPDLETLEAWARRHNLGLRTGKISGVVVIDEDRGKGGSVRGLGLPKTVTVVTGAGGRHYYFEAPPRPVGNSVGKLAPHVDVRADGGQVAFVGSVHPKTGRVYIWADGRAPTDVPLAQLPARILAALLPDRSRAVPPRWPSPATPGDRSHKYADAALRSAADIVRTTTEGNRNHVLNAEAFTIARFIAPGLLDRDLIEKTFRSAAIDAGLSLHEVNRTLRSAIECRLRQGDTRA